MQRHNKVKEESLPTCTTWSVALSFTYPLMSGLPVKGSMARLHIICNMLFKKKKNMTVTVSFSDMNDVALLMQLKRISLKLHEFKINQSWLWVSNII